MVEEKNIREKYTNDYIDPEKYEQGSCSVPFRAAKDGYHVPSRSEIKKGDWIIMRDGVAHPAKWAADQGWIE